MLLRGYMEKLSSLFTAFVASFTIFGEQCCSENLGSDAAYSSKNIENSDSALISVSELKKSDSDFISNLEFSALEDSDFISDREFSALESYRECMAAITMLMYGEKCNKDLKKALSYCLQCLEDFEEDEDCEEGVDPDKYDFCVLAARCHVGLGNFAEAQNVLDKVKNKGGNMRVIEGDIAFRLGDTRKALMKYYQARKLNRLDVQACLRIYTCSQLGLPTSYDRKWDNLNSPEWLLALRDKNSEWVDSVESFDAQDTETIFVMYPLALEDAHVGIPAAMHYLALVYKNGCGFIKKNTDRAEYWLWNAGLFSQSTEE